MKRTILAIFAMLLLTAWVPVGGQAYAEESKPAVQQTMQFTPDSLMVLFNPEKLMPEEKSLFKTMFGTFAVSEKGEGETTVLTRAIGSVSVAAMVLAVVLLSYVIVGSAVNTASSGEPLGRNWSTVWLPLRIAFGFGMLTPVTAGGGSLSAIQVLILKLAVFSSGFASLMWGHMTTDIVKYDSSVLSSVHAPKMDTYVDLANSAICSAQEKWRQDQIGSSAFPRPHYFIDYYDADGNRKKITQRSAPGESSFALPDGAVVARIEFSASGLCGSMDLFPNRTDKTPKGTWGAYQNATKVIMSVLNYYTQLSVVVEKDKMQTKVLDIALNGEIEGGDKVRAYVERMEAAISAHAATYPASMVEAVVSGFKSSVKNVDEEKNSVMAYKSWMFAGNHALKISNYSSAMGGTAQIINKAISNGAWRACGEGVEDCKTYSSGKTTEIAHGEYRSSSIMGWMAIVENAVGKAEVKASPGVNPETAGLTCKKDGCDQAKWVNDLTNNMHVALLDGIKGLGNFTAGEDTKTVNNSIFDVSGSSNPYLVSANIGHGLNAVLVGAWSSGVAIAAAAAALGDSLVGQVGGGAARGALEFVLASIMPLFHAAITAGAVMAYVIPSIIAIRWLFAVLNWILVVIEALSASALWVAIMLSPEGEGITGARAERGLVIIAQVILTPILLIVALIATIAIANVGFMLLNIMWFADPTAYNNNGIFDFVYRLIIYVILLTGICWSSASLIVDLPRAIIDWIGGGVARGMDNHAEQHAVQAVNKAEGATNSAANAGLTAIGKRLRS